MGSYDYTPYELRYLLSAVGRKRFHAKILVSNNPTECAVWDAAINSDGYGNFWSGLRVVDAHVIGFFYYYQRFPADGFEIHHKCENRACVNGLHLLEATHEMNMKLSRTTMHRKPNITSHMKKVCKNKHELTPENVYVDPRGQRGCRICRKNAVQSFRARKANAD